MTAPASYLSLVEIVKEFPGVRALDGVTLHVDKGRILALCGENGAGKSTLMKVLSGVYPAGEYSGDICISGKTQRFSGTRDAEENGVAIIHQELNLLPELTVAENIFIGNEVGARGCVDWAKMHRTTMDLLNQYGIEMDPQKQVKDIKLGQAQLVEIVKALSKNADILILDEPTSALSDAEVDKLFEVMRKLQAKGVTMIYISHKMDEIRRICDQVTVLRDGKSVLSPTPVGSMTKDDIVKAMVGRDITNLYPRVETMRGEVVLEMQNWNVRHPLLVGEHIVEDVSFSVHAGEIFGIYGLMGSGRTELLTGLFGGFSPDDYDGDIRIDGEKRFIRGPSDAMDAGIALVTEDRKFLGLVLGLSIRENTALPSLPTRASAWGVIDAQEEKKVVDRLVGELRVKTPSAEQLVCNLSGGNQQKVVLAKWLARKPRILMLDEPTRGVDVGAKSEIYQIMNDLKSAGVAIIMVTSELPELMGMSDRIMVMREGRNMGIFDKNNVTVERLGAVATGNA